MAQITSQLNGLRLAPRKVRAVVNLLKGKNVTDAINQLEFLIKRPSAPLLKLIKSSIANAENNFHMVKENLYIKEFIVNEGTKLKRFRAKGFGRASMIQKKTSKIKLILDERVKGLKKTEKQIKAEQQEKIKDIKVKSVTEEKKPEIMKEIGKKKEGIVKRLFRRKAI